MIWYDMIACKVDQLVTDQVGVVRVVQSKSKKINSTQADPTTTQHIL